MKKLPQILIYSRLIMGLSLISLSLLNIENFKFFAILFLTLGLITDIFDGIVARKLNVSNESLRRLDSNVDVIFFVSITIATYLHCSDFFKQNKLRLIFLFGIEGLTYLVSILKFKKEIATHTIGAKIWTLILFATLMQIIIQCNSVLLFTICFWIGLITRIEILGITFILKEWLNDVPTIFQALRHRNGKEIKRIKLFNG